MSLPDGTSILSAIWRPRYALCKIKTNQRAKAEESANSKMSKKTKKKGKGKPSSDRLVMKAKQSREMKAKVNPFERRFTKEKHKVVNR